MLAINLNKQSPCEYVCHQVQVLINNFKRDNPSVVECVLVMDIKQITDSNTYNPIPLIEDKRS